jgi:3-phenylpropionate/trans-cinnamate dioxygenase ferredoxin subunit
MSEFYFAANADDVPDGSMKLVEVDDRLVILFHRGSQFYCIDDVCTHDGGTLSTGTCHDYVITCPRHGAEFDIRTGEPLCMPATEPTASHTVKLDDGKLFVRINE